MRFSSLSDKINFNERFNVTLRYYFEHFEEELYIVNIFADCTFVNLCSLFIDFNIITRSILSAFLCFQAIIYSKS